MLDVRLDGEVIATIEEQALAVRIQTSRGETSATGLGPDDGVIDLIIDRVPEGGPRRLDQIEAMAYEEIRERSPEGTITGFSRDHQVHPSGLAAGQGTHNETLREGGVDKELTRRTRSDGRVPQVDLAQGLGADDVDVRSARLTAFSEHGDAQKAIDDNPVGGSNGDDDNDDGSDDYGTVSESGTAYDSTRSADDTSSNPAPPVGAGADEAPTSDEDDDDTKDLKQTSRPTEGVSGGGTKAGIKLPGKAGGAAKKS